ncbi:calcium-binding protein [Sphingomonadaceae bacterium G21617-S1]|nr:calcium-binding protein [Sphingomonadaceae bacterium G21617-S1]
MTELTIFGNAAAVLTDLSPFSLSQGHVGARSGGEILIEMDAGGQMRLSGTGFRFDAQGNVTGGIVSTASRIIGGAEQYRLSGIAVDAATYYNLIANDPYGSIELFPGNDRFIGGVANDNLYGQGGHDILLGGPGADFLGGGPGNDHIYGQSANGGVDGADLISGDDGNDYIQGNDGDDEIAGGNGSDRINGGGANDRIEGDGNGGGSGSVPNPNHGNDTINGNAGFDRINGGGGNDSIRGGRDNDTISGESGDDILMGDLGNDVIAGGGGLDVMTGGSGQDSFFVGDPGDGAIQGASYEKEGPRAFLMDIITDFEPGIDHMVLGDMLEKGVANSAAAADALAYEMFFTPGTHKVIAIQVGSDVYLFQGSYANMPNFGVRLLNLDVNQLSAHDFV